MNRVYWLAVGVAFGVALGVVLAQASDPCDTYKSYEQERYTFDKPKQDEDAAMQFHWSNHQPSLHPR